MDSTTLLKNLKKIQKGTKTAAVYVISADDDELNSIHFAKLPCLIVKNCCPKGIYKLPF